MALKTLPQRLPGEGVPETSSRAVAWVIAIAIVLVLAVNQLVVKFSPRGTRSFDGKVVDTKWDLASAGKSGGAVIVIGDSSGNFGVDAAVLGKELERPAYNLCTYGRFQVRGASWLLDEALRTADAPPKLVLVVLGARTFALSPDGFTFAQIPIGVRKSVFGGGLDLVQSLEFLVDRTLPLFTQSTTIGNALRTGVWRPDLSRLVIEEDGTGRIPAPNPKALPPFAERTVEEYQAVKGAVPSERERAAISDLVSDAEAGGYDLVFVPSPIWEEFQERDEHLRFHRRIWDFLEEACGTSDRAHVLPGAAQTFPAAVMENPFHLIPSAAEQYTLELAHRIRSLQLGADGR